MKGPEKQTLFLQGLAPAPYCKSRVGWRLWPHLHPRYASIFTIQEDTGVFQILSMGPKAPGGGQEWFWAHLKTFTTQGGSSGLLTLARGPEQTALGLLLWWPRSPSTEGPPAMAFPVPSLVSMAIKHQPIQSRVQAEGIWGCAGVTLNSDLPAM